ncbi:MAG: AAC(3) family N-acetyltransferase [Gammaproteobacteria bacterium]|nr:AAC(3) family N-acetyltransferase [Gammaproteobacteria bacterium]
MPIQDRKSPISRVLEDAHGRQPVTISSLVADLTALFDDARLLGIGPGCLLNVHSSLSQIGWVAGGAQAVISALQEVIGPTGTLMMPAHTGHLSDPGNWNSPPVPEPWWQIIRDEMPAFDPALTPTRNMGVIAETFRTYPAVLRSPHPWVSFTARGPHAGELTADHPTEVMFGEPSPIAKLYELDGFVLLLGVDHANNSIIHLAEDRAHWKNKTYHAEGAPVLHNGRREWRTYTTLQTNDEDFSELGTQFAARTGHEIQGRVGWGNARVMRARDIVDFAQPWLEAHR